MGKYFGADGSRGEAGVDLTVEHVYKIGRFLGWCYGQKMSGEHRRIAVGRDTRHSSYMFEYSLVVELAALGVDVYLLHATTTPSVSYMMCTEGFNCRIVVSVNYNSFYDNGVRIINEGSEKLEGPIILEMEKYLDGEAVGIPLVEKEHIGWTVDSAVGRGRYIGYLISIAIRSFENTKVTPDYSNGSMSAIVKNIFGALGVEAHMMDNEPNGLNINMNCGSTRIEHLQKFVVDEECSIESAYDGDTDRCIAVGKNGCVANDDSIMYICNRYTKEQGDLLNSTMVTTTTSNFGLYKVFDRKGIAYVKTTVGDRYVYKNMAITGYCLGGEQSDHIIFSEHAAAGDSILTPLRVMGAVLGKKQPLDKLASEMETYPQVPENMWVKDKKTARGDEIVQAEVVRVTRGLDSNGRTLLRQLGVEPMTRVMVEASGIQTYEIYVDQVTQVMKGRGHCI